MRILALTIALSLLSLPADARRRKRAHHPAPAPAATRSEPRPSASERNAQDYARAESELADLRAGRVQQQQQDDPQTDMHPQSWASQENDHEVPPGLSQKKR